MRAWALTLLLACGPLRAESVLTSLSLNQPPLVDKGKYWAALGVDLDSTPASGYAGLRPEGAVAVLQGTLPGVHAEIGGLYASGVYMRFGYDLRLPADAVVIFKDGSHSKGQLWLQSIRYGPGYALELDAERKLSFDAYVGGAWMQTLGEPGFGEEHAYLGMDAAVTQDLGGGYGLALGIGARFNKRLSNDPYSYLDRKPDSPAVPAVSFSGEGLFPAVTLKLERRWALR